MREETKAELDALFKQKFSYLKERRIDPRVTKFASHLVFLEQFASVQNQIIRPMMDKFGRYLEAMGHRYFIGSVQDLDDGHINPTGRITMHILLNANTEKLSRVTPSLSFRIDETNVVCLYKRIGVPTLSCAPVGHYDLQAITSNIVESHLKEFIIEAVLQD